MTHQSLILVLAFGLMWHTAQAQFIDIERGNRAYNRGEYDEAKRYYDKVASEKSSLEEKKEALFNQANVEYRKRNYAEAIKQFESLAQNPSLSADLRADAHYNIGNALVQQGRNAPVEERMNLYRQALSAYKEALSLNPKDYDAKTNYEFVRSLLHREEQRQKQREQHRQHQQNDQSDKQKDTPNSDTQPDPHKQDAKPPQGEQNDAAPPPPPQDASGAQDKPQMPKLQNFSPEEAERILDALKDNEKGMLKKYQAKKSAGSVRPEKDW
ncbi:MAG: tetratricopeptide repeat protein [Chloroherpetonaceae bacterium]|nr:tetratricopeptide repeat protein [Chloroherpetonaceae bacterium]MDW8464992.1 tetratricopeptide repeat protein [Chloroherpetonaceae bacterium]